MVHSPTKDASAGPDMPDNGATWDVPEATEDDPSILPLTMSQVQTNYSIGPATALVSDYSNLATLKKRGLSANIMHAPGSAYSPFLVDENTSKRKKAALDVWSRDSTRRIETWQVHSKSASTGGVHLQTGKQSGELCLGFEVDSQAIVVCHRGESIAPTYPTFNFRPQDIKKVTRPNYGQKWNFKVRLIVVGDDYIRRTFDFEVRNRDECKYLLATIKPLTYYSEESFYKYVRSPQSLHCAF